MIRNAEQKTSDVSSFIRLVKKYESFTELTPELMHELIDKIVVHAPDKSSGHRTQEVEIHFRFKSATANAMADSMVYNKKTKGCVTNVVTQPINLKYILLGFKHLSGCFCITYTNI